MQVVYKDGVQTFPNHYLRGKIFEEVIGEPVRTEIIFRLERDEAYKLILNLNSYKYKSHDSEKELTIIYSTTDGSCEVSDKNIKNIFYHLPNIKSTMIELTWRPCEYMGDQGIEIVVTRVSPNKAISKLTIADILNNELLGDKYRLRNYRLYNKRVNETCNLLSSVCKHNGSLTCEKLKGLSYGEK